MWYDPCKNFFSISNCKKLRKESKNLKKNLNFFKNFFKIAFHPPSHQVIIRLFRLNKNTIPKEIRKWTNCSQQVWVCFFFWNYMALNFFFFFDDDINYYFNVNENKFSQKDVYAKKYLFERKSIYKHIKAEVKKPNKNNVTFYFFKYVQIYK